MPRIRNRHLIVGGALEGIRGERERRNKEDIATWFYLGNPGRSRNNSNYEMILKKRR